MQPGLLCKFDLEIEIINIVPIGRIRLHLIKQGFRFQLSKVVGWLGKRTNELNIDWFKALYVLCSLRLQRTVAHPSEACKPSYIHVHYKNTLRFIGNRHIMPRKDK